MEQTPDRRPFRLAVVGAGRMGRTHLRALARGTAVAVSDVVEPVAAVRDRLAADGLRVHRTLEDLLARARPDGVLVAAPTDQHAGLIRTAAAAGLAILCEKPAGLTSAEVRDAGRFAAERGVAFQVAYWRRYVPALRDLRERVRAGLFGDIHLVVGAQWDGAPPSAAFRATSGGIFVDMGVHELDQIRWLTGQDVVGVHAVAAKLVSDPDVAGDVDSAQALLELSGGSTGLVSLGRHFPAGDMAAVEVFGSRGHERIVFLDPAAGDTVLHHALCHQAEAFADLVRSGRPTGAGVRDAVAALDAAERATGAVDLPVRTRAAA